MSGVSLIGQTHRGTLASRSRVLAADLGVETDHMRELVKGVGRLVAFVLILPALGSYWIRARLIGRDRALEGSSQTLSLIPGICGQYLRQAFLMRTLSACHPTATVSFGTLFSQCGARLDERVYVGPRCSL